MLLRDFNLIITPARRVGGTSVTRALEPFLSQPADAERFNLGVLSGSDYGRNYPMHGHWMSEVTQGPYLTFLKGLMVRKPVDKVVSAYTALSAQNRLSTRTFRDCVLQRQDLRPTSGDIWVWDHTWRTLTELAVQQGVYAFDDEIRFERLERNFARVCATTRIPARAIPHLRATAHDDYQRYYDEETAAVVVEHFADDLRLFNYTFEGIDPNRSEN